MQKSSYRVIASRQPPAIVDSRRDKLALRIAVIGTGYVGLTTGACLAKLGHIVICADVVPEKIASLQRGVIPIHEEGLSELVHDGVAAGRLSFVVGAVNAVSECDFAFMCLPTPRGADGGADLSFLLSAAKEIGRHLPAGAIVVNKSTVPIGSAELVESALGSRQLHVASNPEFLREGNAVYDFFNPDRIVIGASDSAIAKRVSDVYKDIDAPKMLVNTPTAEMIKYASNAYLSAKLSFANSIADLSEAVGANGHDVLEGMGYDTRIGAKFLKPGPGWGGSCFPKDTYALISIAKQAGYDFDLLEAAIKANDVHTDQIVAKAEQMLGEQLVGAKIAVWGLTYKAGTDDTRESPAIRILKNLAEKGAKIHAYDPAAKVVPASLIRHSSPLSACDEADLLMVLTEWPEFSDISLAEVAASLKHKRILDTRNLLDLKAAEDLGFEIWSLGHSLNQARVQIP